MPSWLRPWRTVHRCAALYERLLPMADEFAVVGAAVFTTGPVALQLGLLAAALGRWDDAARHLQDAAARSDRLGARLHGDRARAELARLPSARDQADGDGESSEFRRDGEVWTLVFAGRRAQLRDAKGLRDLAVLLAAPGREVAAAELAAGVTAGRPWRWQRSAPTRSWTSGPGPNTAPGWPNSTTSSREADAHQDIERSARLAAERDALIDELARATGLGGRRRRLGDAAERARTTVTARIRDAIGRIERAHPELGRHLRASIVTGARCAYRPGETVRWSVSQS